MLPSKRHLAQLTCACAAAMAGSLAGAGSAAATAYVVAPWGSDVGRGTAEAPFQTISRAASLARAGDTVTVRQGRYPETVVLGARNAGAVFKGATDEQPVIDGEGERRYGFRNTGATDLTITGFEIKDQLEAGIDASLGERNVISDNEIHHVGNGGAEEVTGIRLAWGHASRIERNSIHHVGPGREGRGVWLLETRDAQVSGNAVYLARKEGIRDWHGLNNTISGNRVFLNWVGLSLNTSTGSQLTGNYAHDNVEGIAVKHQSSAQVLSYWDLGSAAWSRVTGNTVHRSTETGIWLAQSGQPIDYVEVRDNLFAGAGTAFLRDIPSLRGPNVVVDRNAYSDEGGRPDWVYKAGWSSAPGLTSWADVRTALGWEREGGRMEAFSEPSLEASKEPTWTPFAMTPVDSSSAGTYYTRTYLKNTSDNNQGSYWMTATSQDEYVVFDFGRSRTFNHLILSVYGHEDNRNVRGYRFETSDDRRTWTTIKEGVNPDSAGSAYPYELDRLRSGRYLRFTAVDNFCDSYSPRSGCGDGFVISDVKAGILRSGGEETQPPEPVRSAPPAQASVPAGAPASDAAGTQPPIAGPTLTPAGPGRLTSRQRLRVPLRCTGLVGRVQVGMTISRPRRGRAGGRPLARRTVRVTRDCRAVQIRLSNALARHMRRGKLRSAILSVTLPGQPPQMYRIRIV